MDTNILRRQRKVKRMMQKLAKGKLKTWWATLSILFMATVFFSLVIGVYLTFESSYLQGSAVKVMSYLEFSELSLTK